MSSRELIDLLRRGGWVHHRTKGSHQVFKHPSKLHHIVVPHPNKDLGTGLIQKILKQADLS